MEPNEKSQKLQNQTLSESCKTPDSYRWVKNSDLSPRRSESWMQSRKLPGGKASKKTLWDSFTHSSGLNKPVAAFKGSPGKISDPWGYSSDGINWKVRKTLCPVVGIPEPQKKSGTELKTVEETWGYEHSLPIEFWSYGCKREKPSLDMEISWNIS